MNTFHTYTFPEAKNIIICGDIHGEFNSLIYKLCIQYQLTDTLLIVAGDCGFGFEKPGYYENVFKRNSARLSKANNWIVMVRGNHDDPSYFNSFWMLTMKNMAPAMMPGHSFWSSSIPCFLIRTSI